MGIRGTAATAIACSAALLLTACGSDDEEGKAAGASASGTIDIGLVNSLTGSASITSQGLRAGVEARLAAYEDAGQGCADDLDFNVVEVDDQSSAQGNLAAVQRLVQQDNVYAILSTSSFFFGGIDFMTTQGADVPVLGYALDGPQPQWLEFDNNLFSAFPMAVATNVYSGLGEFMAGQGATKVAGVSFSTPSSQAGLENAMGSVDAAGLQRAYINSTVPFGSSDVGSIVLGIIDSGADGVYLAISPDTGLAIAAGLRQAGWNGTILLPTGYGPDLLASDPSRAAAQGVSFSVQVAPYELGSEAATLEADAIAKRLGQEPGPVSFYENNGWVTADLLLYGLEAAGCDATQQELMDALRASDDYDAGGLLPRPTDFTSATYDESCSYYLTLEGDRFVPVGDEPLCGHLVSNG